MTGVVTLFLDFASHQKSVALVTEKKTVLHNINDHTDESKLMPLIASMIEEMEGVNPLPAHRYSPLQRIVAVTGPGGFMSLRVGLSLANTLSWSLKIPIAGVHLSDLWHARATRPLLWLHSTKKELLFIRSFGEHQQEWPEPTLISLQDLRLVFESLPATRYPLFTGELIEHQQNELGVKRAEAMPLEEILPALCDDLTYDEKQLLPWYGRGA